MLERTQWAWRGDWGLLWEDAHCAVSTDGEKEKAGASKDDDTNELAATLMCIDNLVAAGEWQRAQAQVSASAPLCTDATKKAELADKFPARPAGQAPLTGADAAMIPGQGLGSSDISEGDAHCHFWDRVLQRTMKEL